MPESTQVIYAKSSNASGNEYYIHVTKDDAIAITKTVKGRRTKLSGDRSIEIWEDGWALYHFPSPPKNESTSENAELDWKQILTEAKRLLAEDDWPENDDN